MKRYEFSKTVLISAIQFNDKGIVSSYTITNAAQPTSSKHPSHPASGPE